MIILIEGPRNTGKTFLMDSLEEDSGFIKYKFPYLAFVDRIAANWPTSDDEKIKKLLEQNKQDKMGAFSLGRDLALLHFGQALNQNVIIDRCVFSSLVFGKIFNRYTENEINNVIKLLKEEKLFENVLVFYVTGENPEKRESKDWKVFDELKYELQVKYFDEFLGQFDHFQFVNKFDEESVERFKVKINEMCKITETEVCTIKG